MPMGVPQALDGALARVAARGETHPQAEEVAVFPAVVPDRDWPRADTEGQARSIVVASRAGQDRCHDAWAGGRPWRGDGRAVDPAGDRP